MVALLRNLWWHCLRIYGGTAYGSMVALLIIIQSKKARLYQKVSVDKEVDVHKIFKICFSILILSGGNA